jgi:hypothetical protein
MVMQRGSSTRKFVEVGSARFRMREWFDSACVRGVRAHERAPVCVRERQRERGTESNGALQVGGMQQLNRERAGKATTKELVRR